MCGIAGWITPPGEDIDENALGKMVDALTHRGPDDTGLWSKYRVGLGHRRLSIIDLAGGHQPMIYQERWIISYNGEVYNYASLRRELIEEGYTFSTHSDTEVLLASYAHWGADCLSRWNGMFSLAIYDSRENKLFLARDRMGQKPLYYTSCQGHFLFASELKSLTNHPQFQPVLSRKGLLQYLVYEYLPAPSTIFDQVYKLPAGHYLDWDLSQPIPPSQCYWDGTYPSLSPWRGREEAAEHRFLELLEEAVVRRLISDVPLGVFLSGGIDSSAIVALARRHIEAGKLQTFSVSFQEKSYDESYYIKKVSRHFQTDHHMEVFTPASLYEVLPTIAEGLDEPFADPSILPTYLLSQFTRKYVTVALGGDGGDELFAGYDPFLALEPANWWRRLPSFFHHLAVWGARHLPPSEKNISLDFKINRFLRGAHRSPIERIPLWMGGFTTDELSHLFQPAFLEGVSLEDSSVLEAGYREMASLTSRQQSGVTGAIRFYTKLYLAEDILTKVDRASMLNSLEVRAPFLDVHLVEFANSLPPSMKLRRFTTKYLFKRAMSQILPREITHRKKKGFGIPVGAWLKGPLKPLVDELLHRNHLERQGIFQPSFVARLIEEHRKNKFNHQKPLWALLVFQLWARHWLPTT